MRTTSRGKVRKDPWEGSGSALRGGGKKKDQI